MPGGGTEGDFVNLGGKPSRPIHGLALVAVPCGPCGANAPEWLAEVGELFGAAKAFGEMFCTHRFLTWSQGVVLPERFPRIGRFDLDPPQGDSLVAWSVAARIALAGLDTGGAPMVYLGEDSYLEALRATGLRIIAPFEHMQPVGATLWIKWAMEQPNNPFLSLLLRSDLR